MLKRFAVILIVVSLLMTFGFQVSAAKGNWAVSDVGVHVSIIEPTQELEYSNQFMFEPAAAEITENIDQVVMEVNSIGSTEITSNLPWELYAELPAMENVEVYLKNSSDNNWVKISDEQAVLVSDRRGQTNLNWDLRVVAESEVQLEAFELAFNLDWQRN